MNIYAKLETFEPPHQSRRWGEMSIVLFAADEADPAARRKNVARVDDPASHIHDEFIRGMLAGSGEICRFFGHDISYPQLLRLFPEELSA